MLLQCRNCAGNVTADDEAIRRGVAICDYCLTALRVTKQGVELYQKQLLDRMPPGNIRVQRRKLGIKITIPLKVVGQSGNTSMRARADMKYQIFAIIAAIFIGIVSGWFFRSIGLVAGGFGFISGVIALFVILTFFSDRHPSLRLEDGWLKNNFPGLTDAHNIPVAEIEQLYVTTNRIKVGSLVDDQLNLYVLKKNGQRMQVYGYFWTVEEALFVEELLETELDIFQLPVYGDAQTDTAKVVSFQEQADEETFCYACAAPLLVNLAVRKRGYVTCDYCQMVTLFYTQTSHEPILGQPDIKKMTYRVVCQADRAAVLKRSKKKKGVLGLKQDRIFELPDNAALVGKRVEWVGIGETAVDRKLTLSDFVTGKLMHPLQERLAYSSDDRHAKPVDLAEQMLSDIKYKIVGRIEGENYELIANLDDLREAAAIVVSLNNYLKTFA